MSSTAFRRQRLQRVRLAFAHPRVDAGVACLAAAAAIGLGLRLFLATLPGFAGDVRIFHDWAQRLAADGPWHFYDTIESSDYAPGYLWVLWGFGGADKLLHFSDGQWNFLLKTPAIVVDMTSALLLYRMLAERGRRTQIAVTAAWLLFPPAILIGAFWGQIDSILAFFLLLTVYFFSKDRPVAGVAALTLGFLVKPQAIAVAPFVAFWIVREHPASWRSVPRVWFECAGISMAIVAIVSAPFLGYEPWRLLSILHNASDVASYRVNSFWAYNVWSVGGLEHSALRCDVSGPCANGFAPAVDFLGVSTRYWGIAMFATALAAITFALRKVRGPEYLALGMALSEMAFFLFLTRMHERYVFAAFLPLLFACAILQGRAPWAAFAALAAAHFANLYFVLGGNYLFDARERSAYPDWLRITPLYDWLNSTQPVPVLGDVETTQLLSLMMVAVFGALVLYAGVRSGLLLTATDRKRHHAGRGMPAVVFRQLTSDRVETDSLRNDVAKKSADPAF